VVGFSEIGHIAPVIRRATEEAKKGSAKSSNYYHVLLILTDGFDDIDDALKVMYW